MWSLAGARSTVYRRGGSAAGVLCCRAAILIWPSCWHLLAASVDGARQRRSFWLPWRSAFKRADSNAGFTPWRSTTGAMGRDEDNHQLLTFMHPVFILRGAGAHRRHYYLNDWHGYWRGIIAAGIVALCNGYRLQNRVVIGVSGESMTLFTPGLCADTYVIPLGDVAAERGNNDAKFGYGSVPWQKLHVA